MLVNVQQDHHFGIRIRKLRRAAGMSQAELAARLHVGQSALSMIEQGRNQPTLRIIESVLDIFQLTPNQLFGVDPAGTPTPAPYGDLVQVDADIARITPSVAVVLDRLIESVLALEDLAGAPKHALTPLYVPFELSDAGLGALAERVRQHLRIYDGVVFDYFELFESFGLRVFALPLRINFVGTCFYDSRNDNAFFIINNRHTAERQLFTLAAQLGRLCLHTWAARRGEYPSTPKKAKLDPIHAAAKFAAHFLMPPQAIQATVNQLGIQPEQWTYELLLRIKHRFGVSAEAFLYRLDDLHLIPGEVKKSLRTEIKAHYRNTNYREPDDSRRILTPNGRLWDLVLTASLRLGPDHAELKQLARDLKRMRVVRV